MISQNGDHEMLYSFVPISLLPINIYQKANEIISALSDPSDVVTYVFFTLMVVSFATFYQIKFIKKLKFKSQKEN